MMEPEAEEELTASPEKVSPGKVSQGKVKDTLEKPKALVRGMTNDVLVKSWSTVVQQFCKTTTMHGVSRLNSSTRVIFRFIWFLTVLTFIGILLWQAYLLVNEYRQFPSTTGIHMVTNNKLTFPAVTICNMNKLKRSKLSGTRFEDLVELDERLAIANLGLDESALEETFGEGSDGSTTNPKQIDTPTSEPTPEPTPTMGAESEQPAPSPTNFVSTASDNVASTTNDSQPSFQDETPLTPTTGQSVAPTLTTEKNKVDEIGTRRRRRGAALRRANRRASTFRSIRGNVNRALAFPLIGVSVENTGWNLDNLEDYSPTGDMGKLLGSVNPSRSELLSLGHQAEEFILQCSFNQRECDYRDFSTTFNSQYGLCFTFNRPGENGTVLQTGKTGPQHGLHLTLFTDQSEYIGLLSHQSGVRVAIHQPNVRPFPEDEGLTASTGTLTSIGLRLRNITRLDGRYGDCRRKETFSPVSEFVEGYQYSMPACLNECYQTKLRYECGCVTDVMGNTTQCSTIIPNQSACLQKVDKMEMDNELGCECLTPCREIDYEKFASFSKWPTDSADKHLKKLQKKYRKAGNVTMDAAFRRKNMARLEIFYEKLNYESYNQVPKYNFEGLLGGIGGLMGFFAGMSLITVFELTGFIIQLLGLLVGRLTTPEEHVEGSAPPPHESRMGRMGRRLTLAFSGHHGRRGSGRSRGSSRRDNNSRQTDL